jgi:methylenetetrahydrofolate reductase (NADPH)
VIRDLLGGEPSLSFEFFPPADPEGRARLDATIDELADLSPTFVSVTCGAGGQGHERTRDIVIDIATGRPFPAMAHLTCVGHTRAEVDALLADYASHGIDDVLALAGDPPPDGTPPRGDFTHASELVDVARARGDFSVGVAAHPGE